MKLADLEIGKIYEKHVTAYKVVEVTDRWALVIVYSLVHYNATAEFLADGDFRLEGLKEVEEGELLNEYADMFNNRLKVRDVDTLVYNK